MTRPEDPFEAASYDLNKFRERRMAERRVTPRNTPDRRGQKAAQQPSTEQLGRAESSGPPPQ
jgi:hypothetical protein